MTLSQLNNLDKPALKEALTKCCGSKTWIEKMSSIFPIESSQHLFAEAEKIWFNCSEQDWREAFEHHPKIGDISSLQEKFANTSQWAAGEQASVKNSTSEVLEELAQENKAYEEKFGYIFIVCATGKSAEEMLTLLKARLPNNPQEEIKMAMAEQNKITKIRLEKLLAA